MLLAAQRFEEQRDAKLAANRAYEDYRVNGRATNGRKLGKRPKPWTAPELPDEVVSVSDPDSQRMKANLGYVQGYNAQAVVDEGQIVIAAEITNTPGDFSNLDPMITTALAELERVGVSERPQVALADAGYWNEQHFDEVIANKHIQVLIPPDRGGRSEPRPGWTGGRYSMDASRPRLRPRQSSSTARRIQMIEPVFAHTKHNRLITRFLRQRPYRGQNRMAAADGNPQPHQAPPPPPRRRHSLRSRSAKQFTSPTPSRHRHRHSPLKSYATASRRLDGRPGGSGTVPLRSRDSRHSGRMRSRHRQLLRLAAVLRDDVGWPRRNTFRTSSLACSDLVSGGCCM